MFLKKLFFLFIVSFYSHLSIAQSEATLDRFFYNHDIVQIDANLIHQKSKGNDFHIISIPKPDGGKWVLEVFNSNLISENYISRFADDKGTHFGEGTQAIPTKGQIVGEGQSSVSLTFNDDFIYGYIRDNDGYTFIEPLYYYEKGKAANLFVIYHERDVKPEAPRTCGMTDMHDKSEEAKDIAQNNTRSVVDECYEVEYAIANDFLMYQEFGSSVIATENHAIGVTNNVQTNYDDEFTDELQFEIVEQFTATSSAADPWTTSTSASTLLNSFTDWGPGGFLATHDVGSIWTDRNFDGSTIGIAWLSVVCTNSRYNALQNFTTNPNTKRVMVSHELGHNFSAGHDGSGSGFIMAPSVNTSTTWSSNSISSIESHIASRWCLDDCANSSVPPVAGFDINVIEDCTPGLVQFTSTSTGSTLSYSWSFPGGVPAASSEADPFVTYDNEGTYDATLTVTNAAGSDVITQNDQIVILPSGNVNFSYAISGTEVSFFNLSDDIDFYYWDFGNGASTSQSDPVYDFIDDGVYIVELTGTNDCGTVTFDQTIVIATPPVADFTSTATTGCAPFTVAYTSQSSSNTDTWAWTFEGGTPGSSSEPDPVVVYDQEGTYEVILTVENETGEDQVIHTDYITISDVPTSDFTFTIDGSTVEFTSLSSGATNYMWDFGDGNTSTEESPTHTYAGDGDYEVSLTVDNLCGEDDLIVDIEISLLPAASFVAATSSEGCASLDVTFESTSTNSPETFVWTFESGNPATSTDENPTVTFASAGTFDITLMVTNANGDDEITIEDFVVVNDVPYADFTSTDDGLTTTFVDESTYADTYLWEFGDGNVSTEPNPVHTYGAEGNYDVTLNVTNECGTTTSVSNVNNYTPVEANFNASNTDGCTDFIVDFTDSSTDNATSWLWTFEGGNPSTSTEENPTVTYTESGAYDVSLTVSHPESDNTLELLDYITVNDIPNPTFDFFDNLFVVEFTNTTVGGTSFLWNFGDGNTSTDENPTHTYMDEASYNVTLTVTNECGDAVIEQTIEINNLPTANFAADDNQGCGPFTVTFNDNSSDNVTGWSWTFEGGNPASSTDENPTVTYNTPGMYDVTLEVTSPAGMDILEMPDFVEVLTVPMPEIDAQIEDNIIIASNNGTGTNTTWSVDGNEITDDILNYTFTSNGTYIVTLTVDNECGEQSVDTEVTVDVYAEASLGALPITACAGEAFILSDASTNAETYVWTLAGANPETSSEENPEVVYDVVGSYDIELEVSNSFGSSSMVFPGAVVILAQPQADFEGVLSQNQVTFNPLSQIEDSYLWDFGDGNTSEEISPIHTYNQNGTYEVLLIVENECGLDTFTQSYQIISNAVTVAQLSALQLFPNPTNGLLHLEFDNAKSDLIEIDVIDVNGRVVTEQYFETNKTSINVDHLANGTYFLRLTSNDVNVYKKFVLLN